MDGFLIGPDKTHVGAVLFASKVLKTFSLLDDNAEIHKAKKSFEGLGPGGATNTGEAFKAAREVVFGKEGDRPDKPNVVLVVTDGESTDREVLEAEIPKMKRDGVKIISIGVGKGYDTAELNMMATSPEYVKTVDFNKLDVLVEDIKHISCKSNVILHVIYLRRNENFLIHEFPKDAKLSKIWIIKNGGKTFTRNQMHQQLFLFTAASTGGLTSSLNTPRRILRGL